MPSPPGIHVPLAADEKRQFEEAIARFEHAWHTAGPPRLADYLSVPESGRAFLVQELVAIDKEFRERKRLPKDDATYRQLLDATQQETVGENREPAGANPSSDTSLLGATLSFRPSREAEKRAVQTPAFLAETLPVRFGRFELRSKLGEGAMGAVYLAFDSRLQREVALKFPKFRDKDDPGLLERFYREARSAATLRHPNICPVFDADCIDDVHFIAMAYIQGRMLSQFVDRRALPTPRNAALVVRKIAIAAHEAHERGIVHRDLKPANIIVDGRNEPIVMDFGLARIASSAQEPGEEGAPTLASDYGQTQVGEVIGTPRYMSPEQARGDVDQVGPASDIFSLGVIFYELLTGEPPFSATNLQQLLRDVTDATPRSPRAIRPDLPDELEKICLQMLSKRPEDRPATMKQVADAIQAALKGESAAAEAPLPTPQHQGAVARARPLRQPFPGAWLALAGIILASLGLAGYLSRPALKGVLVVEVDQAGSDVRVLNSEGVVEAMWSGDEESHRFQLPPGKHRLVVEKEGYRTYSNDFAIKSGETKTNLAHLEPIAPASASPSKVSPLPEEGPPSTTVAKLPSVESVLAPEQTYSLPAGCICLALSPDNRHIALGCYDRNAYLFDLKSRKIVHTFGKHATRVLSVDFSPDGKLLATGEDSKQMHVWNVETGKKLHTLPTATSSWGIKFSRSGRQLVAAGGADLWNLTSLASDLQLDGRNYFGTSVAFVPDSNEIAAVDYLDGGVMLIDLATGKVDQQIATLGKGTRCIAVSPDGARLAVAHGDGPEHAGPEVIKDFGIYIFDRASGKQLARLEGHRGVPWAVAYDPSGNWLASASLDGVIRLWHAESLQPGPALRPLSAEAWGLAFFKDGSRLIAASVDGVACTWNLPRINKSNLAAAVAPFGVEDAKRHQQAWAQHYGVPVEYTNSLGMKFRLIAPGQYVRGSTEAEIQEALKAIADYNVEFWRLCTHSEGPPHLVRITQPFYLATTEVTQAQFETVVGRNPSAFCSSSSDANAKTLVEGLDTAQFPVEYLTWQEAADFCRLLSLREQRTPAYSPGPEYDIAVNARGYRMPTDAEWEYACRAGTTTPYAFHASSLNLADYAWFAANSQKRPHPVAQLQPNAFGLFDMLGNAWEMCHDGWTYKHEVPANGTPALDPIGPLTPQAVKVIRGGSWFMQPMFQRSARREYKTVTGRDAGVGFRVALPVSALKPDLAIAAKFPAVEPTKNPALPTLPENDPELGRVGASGAKPLSDWELIYVDERKHIVVAGADGKSLRQLPANEGDVRSLSIQHDQDTIVAGMGNKLLKTSAAGDGEWEVIAELPDNPKEPTVSPDGRRIAWLKPKGQFWDLVIQDVEGKEEVNLGLGFDPHWINNQELVWLRWIGRWVISRWELDHQEHIDFPQHASMHVYPAPSPDGQYYAFSMNADEGRAREIGLVSKDGKRMRQLTTTGNLNGRSIFSPDGRYVAFLRSMTELCVVDTDSGEVREVAKGAAYVRPVWRASRANK